MNRRITDHLANMHPQMLRADLDEERKKVAEQERRLRIGRLVERAFELLGVSKQEAAYAMGYRDPGVISRWCSAVERPLLDKLFSVDGFEDAWLVALAERNPMMTVETIVTIRRSA